MPPTDNVLPPTQARQTFRVPSRPRPATVEEYALVALLRRGQGYPVAPATVTPAVLACLVATGMVEHDPDTREPKLTAAGEARALGFVGPFAPRVYRRSPV